MSSIFTPKPKQKTGSEFVEKTWGSIYTAIKEIFNKNASDLSYEELYR